MTAEKKEITKMTWVHLMGFNEVICIYLSLYNEIQMDLVRLIGLSPLYGRKRGLIPYQIMLDGGSSILGGKDYFY